MTDAEPDELRELRDRIDERVAEYVEALNRLYGGELLHTSWVLVVGMTEITWGDGRESLVLVHRDVPYSTRLGLLTSAQHDLLMPNPRE